MFFRGCLESSGRKENILTLWNVLDFAVSYETALLLNQMFYTSVRDKRQKISHGAE